MSVPDYALEETIDFKFTSRAFATGVPTTLAGTPAVEIYEDNSLTQITAAETLTVDFDGVTGLNNLRVVATAANGFEAGKSYQAVISAGTVSSVSVVGEVVAQFSVQRRPVNWANVTAPTTAVDLSGTDIQLADTTTTLTGHTAQTGDSFARIGVGGAGLTAVPWNASWDAEVQSEVDDGLTAFWTSPATLVDLVWDEAIAGHVGAGSTGAALNAAGGAGDPWITAIPGAYTSGQAGKIVGDALTSHTAQSGDSFAIVNGAAGLVAIDTVVDAIKVVTDALPDSGALTSLSTAAALATAQLDLDTLTGTDGATLATSQPNYAPATAAAMAAAQTDLDTITDTGVTATALTSAAIVDVWSTDALTEAYAADGATATPAQLLYMLWAAVGEFAIASTTITAKKLDGTTTAMTFTLDSDTSPTSRTRAS